MKKRILSIILFCAMFTVILSSCAKEPKKVVFADAGWDSIQFHNAVMMFVAENAYDMETEEISGTTQITWSTLLTGDITAYSEVWSENISTYKDDIASDAVEQLGVNYADNAQGLYVPRYVIEGDPERGIEPMAPDLKTVEDLKNYADVFEDPNDAGKGRIIGSPSGWAADEILRAKHEYYGLDEMYNYVDPGSDAALAASIVSAYEAGEAVVGYYWDPTWLTGKYDLVLLEDADYVDEESFLQGKTEFPSMDLTICVYSEFKEAAPEYCEFLSKYQTSSALTREALGYLQNNEASMEDTAKWFLTQHDEFLDQWLPADKAELIRDALSA